MGGTIFGRSEPGNTNKHELEILGSYLNVQRLAHFHLDLAHFVASHFDRVAKGKVKTIEIGGIVTYIAKKLGCDLTRYSPVDTVAPLIDRAYIQKFLKWTSKNDHYRWKISRDRSLDLPCASLAPLIRLAPAGADEPPFTPSYLVDAPAAAQGDHVQFEGMDVDREPPVFEPPMFEPPMPSPHFPSSPVMPPSAPTYSGPSQTQPPFTSAPQHASHPSPHDIYLAHFNFMNKRFTHHAVNQNLESYWRYHSDVVNGIALGPHPSYYRGADTSGIFEEAGIDRNSWNNNYHRSYGGFGGQFLDEFGRLNVGEGSGAQGQNDDEDGDDEENDE